MSLSLFGPTCGCMGCTDTATAVIDHPEYGQRTVCEGHIDGYDVISELSS